MLRLLPLCLLLAACGSDDTAPVAVSDTDITVSDGASGTMTPTDAPELYDDSSPDATLDDSPGPPPAVPEAAQPPDEAPIVDPVSDDPLVDARSGSLDAVVVGDWTIVSGPAETATFAADGGVMLYAGDRLLDSGTWSVEAGELYITSADGTPTAYTIQERTQTGLTFASPAGEPLVLERL